MRPARCRYHAEMTERIEVELDELTSRYLHNYAQQRGEELAVVATNLLQRQARSDIPSAVNAGIASGRGFWKHIRHCPVDTCDQGWWILPMTPAGAPVDATTVQAAMDDHVREAHPDSDRP